MRTTAKQVKEVFKTVCKVYKWNCEDSKEQPYLILDDYSPDSSNPYRWKIELVNRPGSSHSEPFGSNRHTTSEMYSILQSWLRLTEFKEFDEHKVLINK